MATFIPDEVKRCAKGGPAWPVPMMIASKVVLIPPHFYNLIRPAALAALRPFPGNTKAFPPSWQHLVQRQLFLRIDNNYVPLMR